MPSTFQTCLLVSALASFTNAQLFLNLESGEFSLDRSSANDLEHHQEQEHIQPSHEDVKEHHMENHFEPELDHHYDTYDEADVDEQKSREQGKHFQEVHHPDETLDYGSREDEHRHDWKLDDKLHPREATEDYQKHYYDDYERQGQYGDYGYYRGHQHHQMGDLGHEYPEYHDMGMGYGQHHLGRYMPRSNAIKPDNSGAESPQNDAFENVLSDEDPAICFVKAYARKPLGMPTKKRGQHANSMHDYWYDDEDDEENDYEDDDNDLYGDEDDEFYTDSEDEFYDTEDESSGVESSLDEGYEHFDLGEDVWDKERHYGHAQYFDLANQQPPAPTPAPAGGSDSDDDSQESVSSDDDGESSDSSANAYEPHPRRRRAHGQGRGGRRTRRHPTQPMHAQPAPRHRRHPRTRDMLPSSHQRPHRGAPAHSSPHGTEPAHDAPAHRRQTHPVAAHLPVHDRHAPPPSARRHRRGQKSGKRTQRQGGQRGGGQRRRRQQHPGADGQGPHKQRQQRQRKRRPTNDESLDQDDLMMLADSDDLTCPKFFEMTELGCEKPLSLWRGNGQKKKCSKCQKCEDKWYPQCPPSFVVTECDVCAPVCPDGMIDHDGTCMKAGQATIEECGPDEQLIDGECYRQCPGQTSEFDILCFGLCPMDMYKCGHTLCLKNDQQCPQYVADKAINLDKLVEKYKRKDTYGSRLIDLSHQSMFPFPECH